MLQPGRAPRKTGDLKRRCQSVSLQTVVQGLVPEFSWQESVSGLWTPCAAAAGYTRKQPLCSLASRTWFGPSFAQSVER